jgi:hypothetical protein
MEKSLPPIEWLEKTIKKSINPEHMDYVELAFEKAKEMEQQQKELIFSEVQNEIRKLGYSYPHIFQGNPQLTELSLNIAYLKNTL